MFRVLIVDDEPMICKGLMKTIQQAADVPTEIRTAEDGVHAMEMIELLQPDFVFTDIRMPKMDGLELCKRISERFANIKVVVVSGYGEFEYARKCLSYGVVDYLLKPIIKRNVHEVLRHLVEKRKSGHYVYISPSMIEEWIAKIGESVWMVDEERLVSLLGGWEAEIRGMHLGKEQSEELHQEMYSLFLKNMKARGMHAAAGGIAGGLLPESAEGADLFRMRVLQSLSELKEMRKGNFKDPVEEAKAYIEQNLSREITLEEVAQILGLNPSYFSQLFKQKTSETFIHYRIKRKMEKAKRLLELPHYRITDISYEIGYADHPHFTKTFKKFMGISPSEYRRMIGIE